jgi:cytochrome c peroxidase
MKKITYATFVIAVTLILLAQLGCRKEKESRVRELSLPATPYAYNSNAGLPPHAPNLGFINNDVATLGRVIFFDNILSLNNSVACATCHKQEMAFADGKKGSTGFMGKITPRNSMAIVNVIQGQGFFWDLRESDLTSMVVKPVQNHIEMGFDSVNNVISKMEAVDYYKPLFAKAYGSEQITVNGISRALTEYLRSMVTYRAKYDEGVQNNFANFSARETRGREIFQQNCNSCHNEPTFQNPWMSSANIGLDEDYEDEGAGNGFFKIPSLRNVELTGPYMHDGRFKTLEEVVEQYNSGIKSHPALDWNLRNQEDGTPKRLNLSNDDKEALVAFLKTLTDWKVITDEKFSNPFH